MGSDTLIRRTWTYQQTGGKYALSWLHLAPDKNHRAMIQHTSASYRETASRVVDTLANYLEQSQEGNTPVVQLTPIAHLSQEMNLAGLIRKGGLDLDRLTPFLEKYLDHSMHMHHPGYIGHQVAVPHPAAALADMIHGLICNPMSIYEMGPSAAAIEQEMVQWMLEKVGWKNQGAGLFTHGGSLANIHAMLAARAATDPDAWKHGVRRDLVVLAPDNTHYSIARAVSITGLGSDAIIPIPTNDIEVVRPEKLQEIIRDQRNRGKEIMAVVANACATSTGLYDPVDEMAECCLSEKCWFHIDSPHGATAILSEKYRHLLRGLEKADSLIWDAHKMMQTSSLSTAILFKDKKHYYQTFSQKASYLIHEKENPGIDVLPFQIECTKSAIATKLFFVLAAIGENGMAQFIDNLYDNTRHFADIIRSRPGFSCKIPVDSNILCFQYRVGEVDQLKLREQLIRTGEFYITSTEIRGIRYLRLVVMHTGTTADTIENLLDKIEELAQSL